MSLDQSIRWKQADPRDTLNPNGLFDFLIKGSILAGAGSPVGIITAPLGSTYTDTSTGQEYIMDSSGVWTAFINYSSFAPSPPDPFVRNEIDVTTIKPNTANSPDIGIVLATTTDAVTLGVPLALTNCVISGDGSIISSSATASHVVSNGVSQVTYGHNSVGSSAALSVVGGTSLSLSSSVGNVNINAAADVSVGALANATFTVGGNPTFVVQPTDVALTGDILPTSSSTYVCGRNTNTFAEGHFDGVFTADGTGAAPSYSWDSSHSDGLYLNAVGNPAISASGAAVMGWASGTISAMATILPTATNTFDLGSALFDWRNIYSQNVLTVVSDGRLKKEIEDLSPQLGLSFVESLKPVSFKWKDESDKYIHLGVVAQDVESSLHGKGYAVDSFGLVKHHFEGDVDKYTMSYDELIAPLIKSVKELSARVKELESKIHYSP